MNKTRSPLLKSNGPLIKQTIKQNKKNNDDGELTKHNYRKSMNKHKY